MIGKDFVKRLKTATSSIERIRLPAKEWVIPRWWIKYSSGPRNVTRLSISGSHAAIMQNNIIKRRLKGLRTTWAPKTPVVICVMGSILIFYHNLFSMDNKKGHHRMVMPFFIKCIFYQEQHELVVPQLEHPAPKSMPDVILNPNWLKSTLIGFDFSINTLSTTYLNPSTSYILSLSFNSSRVIAREGPPHPPAFKKIRIGDISLSLKYSPICVVAAFVISTITSSLIT